MPMMDAAHHFSNSSSKISPFGTCHSLTLCTAAKDILTDLYNLYHLYDEHQDALFITFTAVLLQGEQGHVGKSKNGFKQPFPLLAMHQVTKGGTETNKRFCHKTTGVVWSKRDGVCRLGSKRFDLQVEPEEGCQLMERRLQRRNGLNMAGSVAGVGYHDVIYHRVLKKALETERKVGRGINWDCQKKFRRRD